LCAFLLPEARGGTFQAPNQGIAARLVITVRAVEKYVSSIFAKLGLPSTGSESRRVLAVLTFLRS
jgi:DNA-binding NarL/FixJ family response regulator